MTSRASFDCSYGLEFRLLTQQPTDQDLTGPNRMAHLSSTTLETTHDQHHPSITPFLQQSQQMTHSNNAGPISTGTSTSSNSQSQATAPSAMHMPKALAGMGSTVDRTAFRQQPPPMKVSVSSKTAHFFTLCILDLSIVSTADPSQCSDLSDLQSEESLAQSEETQTSSHRCQSLSLRHHSSCKIPSSFSLYSSL